MRHMLIVIGVLLAAWSVLAQSTQEPKSNRYGQYEVEGWTIVGVWQKEYGIDVRVVIEGSASEYRVRWVSSDAKTSTKSKAKLREEGNTYYRSGSATGDYYKVLANGDLRCHDDEGYISTLKPVPTSGRKTS